MSYGLYSRNSGSIITLGSGSTVTTYGEYSDGVLALDAGRVTLGDNVTITTNGKTSHGICAYNLGASVSAGRLSITTNEDKSHGAYAYNGAKISLGEGTTILTKGGAACGIASYTDNSSVSLGAGSSVTTEGKSSYGVVAINGGKVFMEGASIAVGAAESFAIASGTMNGSGSVVSGDGVFSISGDIISETSDGASGSTLVDLTLEDTSSFIGATAADDASTLDLTLNGASSAWTVTGDSTLTTLTLRDGSELNYWLSELGTTVTVTDLNSGQGSSGGTLTMKTDIASGMADRLIVDGTAEGRHEINVLNSGSDKTDGTERVTLVEVNNPGQSLEFTLKNVVELGGWQYVLSSYAGTYAAKDT